MDDVKVPVSARSNRFLDQLRYHMRQSGLAYTTEKTYILWIRRYINYSGKRHPKDLGKEDIHRFLSFLSIERSCSVNTQKIALNSLSYLYNRFFNIDISGLNFTPARQHQHLPVVYTRDELKRIFDNLRRSHWLIANVMYGGGLRLAECLSLRVKDIDIERQNVIVRSGKGGKDRSTILPLKLVPHLQRQIALVDVLHKQDLADGFGEVYMPDALARKYPAQSKHLMWQFVFPSSRVGPDPRSGVLRRHHLHPTSMQKAFRNAFG
ncbi:integron integrase [Aurantivibrio plasticivorans]